MLKITPTEYAIHKDGEHPLFGSDTIIVKANGDASGLFVTIAVVNPECTSEEYFGDGKFTLDTKELKAILEVVEKLEEDWRNI